MAIYSKSDIMTQTYELEPAVAQTVLGTHDDNLKVLENQLAADIFVRGTAVTLTGPTHEIVRARKVLDELQAIARRGHVISPESVKQAVAIVTVEAPLSVSKALAENIITRRGKAIRPKTWARRNTWMPLTRTPLCLVWVPQVLVKRIWPWLRPCRRCTPSRSAALF